MKTTYLKKHQDYYARHRKRIRYTQQQFRLKRQSLIAEFKKKPCADCGKTFLGCQMDFDHRPGTKKLFTISSRYSHAWRRLITEIKKCDVVCANCHRLRTYRRKQHATSAR